MSIRSALGLAAAPNRTPFPHPHPARRERARLQEHALERERADSVNECTIKIKKPADCGDYHTDDVKCEDHFYVEDNMWYRCKNPYSSPGKCRAKGTLGRSACDIPVRADAHLHAASSECHPRTLHSVRRKGGRGNEMT